MNENIDLYNADTETLVRCASMKSVWREWAAGHDNTESEVEAETARFAGRLESIVLAWRARVEDALRLRAERRDVAQNVFSHLLGSYQDASRLRPADIEARARLALQAATVFQEVASKEPAP